MVTITLPDGSMVHEESGITGAEFIEKHIGEGLLRAAVAVKYNDVTCDLTTPITENISLTVLTFKDEEGKEVFWHSAAHVYAIAVTRLFPKAKLTIGPPIKEGFYYDVWVEKPFTDSDIENIRQEMKKVVSEDIAFTRDEISYDDAKKLFSDNKYKLELVEEYKETGLTVYKNDTFFDLCRGPHVLSTGKIKAFELLKYSGAYWRGDAKNDQLQRVYGIAFPNKDLLKEYVHKLEEAKKRDHRKIVMDLDLAMFHEFSPGNPFFLPKGASIYTELINFVRSEYKKRGYDEVITPQLYNKKLWEISGHWEHYREDMFTITIEGQEHSLKPMNCPSHCLIFNRSTKSYKDLPLRIADFCMLHRNELSGTLTGLTRVRKFAQDDAHIFCTMEQVESEVFGVLEFIKYVWEEIFGFTLTYYLSTRPENKLGDDALWNKAEAMLKTALQKASIQYIVKPGEGAFYGPKIDIDLEDALGRKWQCPTCQLDFNLPNRFNCQYEGADGKKHTAVMIHRAILGSLERFIGIMLEHYAGKLPLWISPEQIRLLPIADRHVAYCKELQKTQLSFAKVTVDDRPLTTSKKVRDAQLYHINYILVVGDSEVEKNTVNVRTRDNIVHGEMGVEEFSEKIKGEILQKK